MSVARIRFGLPLGGIDKEDRVALPAPTNPGAWAAQDLSGWRFDMARNLMPLPLPADFANNPDSVRVTRLFNVRFGNDTAAIVRHTHSGFYELANGVWTSRTPAAGFPTTVNSYWGSALVPSPAGGGDPGKGLYMFSNRVIGPFTWNGSGVASAPPASALPARHVVSFADRAILLNVLSGGNIRGRTGQWSVAGDATTFTGTGSGNRDFLELEGEITGAGVIRRSLFVYSRTGLVGGVETFDAENPISYGPVVTRGVGLWAPESLLGYNDIHAFLSEEGFKSWDGSQFIPIGSRIDTHILSRINRDAISTVSGFVKPDWNIAFWALPMDSSTIPTEGWFYDYKRQSWHRVDLNDYFDSPSTSFALVFQAAGVLWNNAIFGVPWNSAGMASAIWVDFRGAASRPTVLVGHNSGSTSVLDESRPHTNLKLEIETPDFTWEGTPIYDEFATASRSPIRVVNSDTITTLDQIELMYRTIDGAPTFHILVSGDGGETFSSFGSVADGAVTFTAGAGDRVRRLRAHGRFSGATVRVKLTNKHPITGVVSTGAIHLEDMVFTTRETGEIRSVA